jgi:hypothetical protein
MGACDLSVFRSFGLLIFRLLNSKCFAQSPDAFSDLSLVHSRVTEDYPWPRRPGYEAMGDSGDADSTRCRMGHQSFFGSGFFWPQHDMRARGIAGYLDTGAEVLLYCFE